MTNYWECTQCKNWQSGGDPPDQCSNCENPEFDPVPEVMQSTSWRPAWDLGGFTVAAATVLFLALISVPLGPMLNEEFGGTGDVVALGGLVSTFLMAGLMYAVSTRTYRGWLAAVVVFSINAVGFVVMAIETLANVELLSGVNVLGQSLLVLIRNFAGATFVELFQLGTSPESALVVWLLITAIPLSMLIYGRDQVITE